MTKHVSGQLRTKRFVLMMTPGEYTAVEDFRFANRIGTMAEAVRVLCMRSLTADGDVNTVRKNSEIEE